MHFYFVYDNNSLRVPSDLISFIKVNIKEQLKFTAGTAGTSTSMPRPQMYMQERLEKELVFASD